MEGTIKTLLCDICGQPATDTINFKALGKMNQIDVCADDLADLVKKAHAPRRGRKPKSP